MRTGGLPPLMRTGGVAINEDNADNAETTITCDYSFNSMVKELPDVSDREIVQMLAAQQTVLDNHEELDREYKQNIEKLAGEYGIEINV